MFQGFESHYIKILRRKVAQSKDLAQELFFAQTIIEKYWKLMEKLNIEIPISPAVLIFKKAHRLNETRALKKRVL